MTHDAYNLAGIHVKPCNPSLVRLIGRVDGDQKHKLSQPFKNFLNKDVNEAIHARGMSLYYTWIC